MTSAPVKGVDTLMNFVGGKNSTQTGGTESVSSFGDVMSRTQSGVSNSDTQKQSAEVKGTRETSVRDAYKKSSEAVKETKTAGEAEKTGKQTKEVKEAVEKAGKELVKDIAKELGVSEEEVVRAMEELGFSMFSLFDPTSLMQLVLALTGNEDASILLTDEGLFGKVQELLQLATDVKDDLVQELDLEPDEMKSMLEELQKTDAQQPDMEEPLQTKELAPQITVEVHTEGETVKLAADENGNVVKTLETVSQEESKTAVIRQEDGQKGGKEEKGQSQPDGNSNTGNALLDALTQDKTPVQNVQTEQANAFFGSQTQDIMNQIMDYMKIQLRPGMDQLEMQLHPESLGTVHVQLVNKGGEITAQFRVQNETVRAAIESQIVELKENLKDQGVKVEAVEVTVESHGFESNLWQGQGREENASSRNGKKTPRKINLNELDALFEERASEEELLSARMMEMNGNTVDYTA